MKFSIIVPVYNAENYLVKCIDSVLAQEYSEFELILVDDGSTDFSLLICKRYAELDTRIKVISKVNKGVGSARNAGIQLATGQLILFLDSDDELMKNTLSICMSELDRSRSDLLVYGYVQNNIDVQRHQLRSVEFWRGSRNDFLKNKFDNAFEAWLIHSPWNKVFVADLLKSNNISFNETYSIYEDLGFVLEYLSKCNDVTMVSEALYIYNIKKSGSLVTRFHMNSYIAYLDSWEKLMSLILLCKNKKQANKYNSFFSIKILSYLKELYQTNIDEKVKLQVLKDMGSDCRLGKLLVRVNVRQLHLKIKLFLLKHQQYSLLDRMLKVLY